MTTYRAAAAAWTLASISIGLCVVALVLLIAAPGFDGAEVFPVAFISFPVVGAVIVGREPRNPIGWLLTAFGIVASVGICAQAYAQHLADGDVAATANWVGLITLDNPTTFTYLVLVLLLFPNGRLPTRRWRPVLWFSIGASALLWFFTAFKPGGFNDIPTPFAIEALAGPWRFLEGPLVIGVLACAPLAMIAFILRFRRSAGVERQQLRWFAYAGGLFGTQILLFPLFINVPAIEWMWPIVFGIATISIPVATGIAILRYRLYDIDRFVSRTITYGVLVVLLGGLYAAVVIGLGQTFVSANSDVAIAASTLVTATVFAPLRNRIRGRVDRRFDRRRYDAERTIEAFAARLREQIDIGAIEGELCTVVDRTLQPTSVWVWTKAMRRQGL